MLMPRTVITPVQQLNLDLENYRTIPQSNEITAVQAMISISPDYFWGLMDSILADEGFLPTENILVLDLGTNPSKLVVKEGNRRIAVLKLILGYLPSDKITIPDSLQLRIKALSSEWIAANQEVPCAIYQLSEAATVDRIVTIAHGKGDKASRDKWNAVARARHSRDVQKVNQPALDVLEQYVGSGTNLTTDQAKRWAGDYPLTILDEAMKRLAPRLGFATSPELARNYPSISYLDEFDAILLNIGLENIKFGTLRTTDFGTKYGIPLTSGAGGSGAGGSGAGGSGAGGSGAGGSGAGGSGAGGSGAGGSGAGGSGAGGSGAGGSGAGGSGAGGSGAGGSGAGGSGAGGSGAGGSGAGGSGAGGSGAGKKRAVAINDPRAVKNKLRKFKPLGNNREKVVSLRDETRHLDLTKNPIAFCFLLRSMFEISAKAYCDDHKATGGPSAMKADGTDRRLIDVLRDICKHMETLPTGKPDPAIQRQLHGALTELANPASVLSVTSMNQLVHNPKFSIRASDISTMFGNIFPLLEAMNK
jgi:hypothetical protein